MRIGVFGGTFDPPHVGHLLVATDAYERLALDRLIFVPAGTQPLKADRESAPAALRLEMVRRMIDGDPRFEVDPLEIDRGGLSFMVDTLGALADRWRDAELLLLVGEDVLTSFHRWREPERIRSLATMVVLARGDDATRGETLPGGPPQRLATRRIDVSSTEIRARVQAGQSIRGFVPESVADVIRSAGLYR